VDEYRCCVAAEKQSQKTILPRFLLRQHGTERFRSMWDFSGSVFAFSGVGAQRSDSFLGWTAFVRGLLAFVVGYERRQPPYRDVIARAVRVSVEPQTGRASRGEAQR